MILYVIDFRILRVFVSILPFMLSPEVSWNNEGGYIPSLGGSENYKLTTIIPAFLNWWAWNTTIRAEYTAIPFFSLDHFSAIFTFIEHLTTISNHFLFFSMTTIWTCDYWEKFHESSISLNYNTLPLTGELPEKPHRYLLPNSPLFWKSPRYLPKQSLGGVRVNKISSSGGFRIFIIFFPMK